METLPEELVAEIFDKLRPPWATPVAAIESGRLPIQMELEHSEERNGRAQKVRRVVRGKGAKTFLYAVPLVCRQWRDLAQTPHFWSHADIDDCAWLPWRA